MPKHLRMLLARGYWDQAGDGTSGSSAGGAAGGSAGGEGGDAGGEGGKEGEGKSSESKPSDAEAKLLKEVMEKKKKLQAQETELAQVKDQLKQFEGLDVTQIRQMLKDAEDRKTRELEEKGQWEALKKQIVEQHGKQLTEKETAVAAAQKQAAELQAQIAELTVGNAFAGSRYISESLALPSSKARVLFGAHFEFDGAKVVAYDKPAGAKDRAVLVDARGDALGFEAAIAKLVEADPDRDTLLKSKLKTGAGSKTEAGAKAPERTVVLSGQARIAAALAARSAAKR